MSIERVQQLVDSAARLRMQSVAVPLKDLQSLLRICEAASEQSSTSSSQSESLVDVIQQQV
jgi:hypothetical protein